MFISKLSVPWPAYVQALVGSVFGVVSIDLVSLTNFDCASQFNYFDTFTMMMVAPLCLTAMFLICLFSGMLVIKRGEAGAVGRDIWKGYSMKIFSLALFALYPTLSKYVLQMWKCTEVEGVWYLDADLRLECEGPQYESMNGLAVFFFLLYPFGIPFAFTIALYKSRDSLEAARAEAEEKDQASSDKFDPYSPGKKKEVLALGWLAIAYEAPFWFWEILEFFRKLVLSGILVFVQPGTSAQVLVAIMVSVLFLGFVSYFKPYEKDTDDTFGFISFICLVYTLVLGLALRVAATENLDVYQQAIYSVALLLVNLTLIGLTLWSMLQNVLVKPRAANFDRPSTDRKLAGEL